MKRQILKGMIFVVLNTALAQAHTNKTFLQPRSQSVDLPMEYTAFKRFVTQGQCHFGGALSATTFGGQSESAREIAKYFLVNNKSTIRFPLEASLIPTVPPPGFTHVLSQSTVTNDVDLGYLEHFSVTQDDVDAFELQGGTPTLSLDPEQSVWGVELAYHQKLGNTGWVLDAVLPIVDIEHEMNFKFTGEQTSLDFGEGAGLRPFNVTQNLMENFTGVPLTLVDPAQEVRSNTFHTKAKLGNTRSVGAADLDVRLGYQLFDRSSHHVKFGFGVTVPMGNRPTGEFIFEAIRGNGRHWGFGGDANMDARIWGTSEHNVTAHVIGSYRYLFTTTQMRTLGLKGRPFGQHYLLGKNDPNGPGGVALIPAANVLTLPVDVTGRSQFDSVLGLAYNNKAVTVDAGYNFYYRDHETVKQRSSFVDKTYAVASRGFTIDNSFDITDEEHVDGGLPATTIVNDTTIDVNAAATPSQLTHALYGSVGYMFNRHSEKPWLLSAGSKYEWATRNSALEQWELWVKGGIGF